MDSSEKLRLTIIYDTGSTSYRSECIVTRLVYEDVICQWENIAEQLIHFRARLNDIDGNAVEHNILRESIHVIEATTVNGMESG